MPFDGKQIPLTAQQLLTARAYLVEHGWCKGKYGDLAGKVCMLGAVIRSGLSGDQHDRAIGFLMWACKGNIPNFNDNPKRTLKEVLAVFDVAVSRAMEE